MSKFYKSLLSDYKKYEYPEVLSMQKNAVGIKRYLSTRPTLSKFVILFCLLVIFNYFLQIIIQLSALFNISSEYILIIKKIVF